MTLRPRNLSLIIAALIGIPSLCLGIWLQSFISTTVTPAEPQVIEIKSGSSFARIANQLEHGLAEAWEVAKRGDEIDDAVRRLDPTALRSKLATLSSQAEANPSPEAELAVKSVERQLESADRLKAQSGDTAASLILKVDVA